MDRAKFFDAIRSPLFGGKLSASQVEGLSAILDEVAAQGVTDIRHVAYILATPHLETGAKFQPIAESLNYSVEGLKRTFSRARISAADCERLGRKPGEAPLSLARQAAIANLVYGGEWGRKNLGNTQPTDGWDLRGSGFAQITGRANYSKFGIIDNPEAARVLKTAARILVRGMTDGTFTGRKLSEFFNSSVDDPVNARRIINSLDRAADIAGFYRLYLAALSVAGWKPGAAPAPAAPVIETPAPAATGGGGIVSSIVAILRKLFGGK